MRSVGMVFGNQAVIQAPDGQMVVLNIPRPSDSFVEELFEAFDRIPPDLCLVLDRQTKRLRICNRAPAGLAEGGHHVGVEAAAGESLDQRGLQAEGDAGHLDAGKARHGVILLLGASFVDASPSVATGGTGPQRPVPPAPGSAVLHPAPRAPFPFAAEQQHGGHP